MKTFRNSGWRFQQAFEIPGNDLQRFASTIHTASSPLRTASLTSDGVVFELKPLLDLLTRRSIPSKCQRGTTLTAVGRGDSIDLLLVLEAKSFAIFCDHDEFTTFYVRNRSNLNRVTHALIGAGFKSIPDYERQL